MKDKDIDNLIEQLQGFDGDELRREMTDGLGDWCDRHVQRAQTLRRAVAMLVVFVVLSAAAMTLSPDLRQGVFHPKPADEPAVEQPSPTPAPRQNKAAVAVDTGVVAQDTTPVPIVPQRAQEMSPEPPKPRYDFAATLTSGDTLFCTVVRVAHSVSVSVQDSRQHPSGALVLPAVVEHDGLKYQVASLADSAFYNCRELSKLTLPPTLSFVGRDAFCGCSALDTVVTLAARPPRIKGEWCFWEVPQSAVLLVPCRSGTAYRSAHCWDYFESIVDSCEAPPLPENPVPTIRFNGSYLIVEGVYGEVVRVYDIEGRLIASELCNGLTRVNIGLGRSFSHTSALLIQVGENPVIKATIPLRNNASVGNSYRYWGNGF